MAQEEISERVLDKIKKLNAKVESCEKIGSREEAEAFAAMVNHLLLKHNLSMSDLEFSKREVEDPIIQRWVDYEAYGIKSKRARIEWSEKLAGIIARAHFCRTMIRPGSNWVCFIGHQSNREVAEYLFVTMYRSAERMADQAYAVYWRECDHAGDVTQCRGFRASWLTGFIQGLRTRFDQERKTVTAEASVTSTVLVRIDQTEGAVDRWMKEHLKIKSAASTHQAKFHPVGLARGRQAADDVSLRADALRTNPSRGQGRLK